MSVGTMSNWGHPTQRTKRLLARHTIFKSEFSNLESASKLEIEELQSLKMEAQTAKESINSLKEVSKTKEGQIHTLKEEFVESKRGHKRQLDIPKAAYNELLAKHLALESEFKNL